MGRMRHRASVAVLGVVAGLILLPASASSPPTRCDRFTGRTVTANAYARLYVPASRIGDHNLYSCTFDTARRRILEVPNDTQTWFEPSARLRRHLVAYALAFGESEEWKSDDEWIVVRDVRRASPLFSTFRRVIPIMEVDNSLGRTLVRRAVQSPWKVNPCRSASSTHRRSFEEIRALFGGSGERPRRRALTICSLTTTCSAPLTLTERGN